jgi:hypothetical protein
MTTFFGPPTLLPDLGASTQTFIRMGYGVLLAGTLLMSLPHGRRYFVSERWGGYAESAPDVDPIQNPIAYPLVMLVWLGCAILITLGWWAVWAALVNLLLCRYFFVRMRWKGVLRGMGAPGFMTYWLAAAVFLLEYTWHYASNLQSLALLVLQVDFAFIMLSAGVYKFTAGYPRNQGMELGLVNPEWGYWPEFYKKLSPEHWLIKIMNQLAWGTEVVSALLMLVPATRLLGSLLIIGSFIFIATQIRLAFLTQMVMLGGVLFFYPDSFAAQWIDGLALPPSVAPEITMPAFVNLALAVALWGYLVLLPLAHAGLFYNFYARKSLPGPLQSALERYTNFFGIIIWRVFSVDVVNFFIRVYRQHRQSGERVLISRYGWPGGVLFNRYNHVAESITVTSLFTTLKYYPSNATIFTERLLRYARTVSCPSDAVLVFEHVSLTKAKTFEFLPVAEFVVDLETESVEERILEASVSVRAAHAVSPVREGMRPGSYIPLEKT